MSKRRLQDFDRQITNTPMALSSAKVCSRGKTTFIIKHNQNSKAIVHCKFHVDSNHKRKHGNHVHRFHGCKIFMLIKGTDIILCHVKISTRFGQKCKFTDIFKTCYKRKIKWENFTIAFIFVGYTCRYCVTQKPCSCAVLHPDAKILPGANLLPGTLPIVHRALLTLKP